MTIGSNARPPHPRPCPLCGVAMLGKKSHLESEQFDIFYCLNCKTMIDLSGTETNKP
jgi:hypothetical protein